MWPARWLPEIAGDDSVYFQSFNRNKKSITLNLRHPEATTVLHPLVRRSDCVFNNLRGDLPGSDGTGLPQPQPSQAVHCLRFALRLWPHGDARRRTWL